MAEIWSDARKYQLWLQVELAAARAMESAGRIPRGTVAAIESRRPIPIDPARIDEIERTTRHDVIAFLTHIEELVGEPARHLHLGMTSSDVLDTAFALQLTAAAGLIEKSLDRILAALRKRAGEHRHTLLMGRTHGVHAEPTTFGLVLTSWYAMMRRLRDRFLRATQSVKVGKISGAVGTFAHLDPSVEESAMAELGLAVDLVSTQVISRDRHADFFTALAQIGSGIEHIAVNLRHFQRTEVREVEEAFGAGQKGSSAMPHKRNPISAENLTGVARLLRGYALSALESVALWHERDISHSSVERMTGPDATSLAHYALDRLAGLVENMTVFPEIMRRNFEQLRGLPFSGEVLVALVDRGMQRQAAYVIVQRNAMRVWQEDTPFIELLLGDAEVTSRLSPEELRRIFDPWRYLQHVDAVFTRVFGPGGV